MKLEYHFDAGLWFSKHSGYIINSKGQIQQMFN